MQQVFVSHTSEEADLADALRQTLQEDFEGQLDFFVSSDANSLLAGDKWLDGLSTALRSAQFLLVLCSEYSVGKPWVNFEAGAGWVGETRVIPICHSNMGTSDLPRPLSDLQAIEAGTAEGLKKLYSTFSEQLGAKLPERNFEQLATHLRQVAEDIERPEIVDGFAVQQRYESVDTADVLVAFDSTLKRTVVKKVLRQAKLDDEFMANAQAATRLSGLPNFISVYSAGYELSGRPYLMMQHLENGNLGKHIGKSDAGELDIEFARRVVFRVGEAVNAAHSRNVAIGNLKSTNILLDEYYEPYLSPRTRNTFLNSFDLKKAVENRLVTMEDLAYTAPEVLSHADGDNAFHFSDQYALGILAFELLTGKLPTTLPVNENQSEELQLEEACSLIERMGQNAFHELPWLSDLRPDIPVHVSKIIGRMVSLDCQDRFARLDLALDALRSASNFLVQTAQESYVRCLENTQEPGFFQSFYDKFTSHEEVAERFSEFDSSRWTQHHGKLQHSLDASFSFVLNYIPNVEMPEPNALTQHARMHGSQGLGIRKQEYKWFVDALVNTVCGEGKNPPYDPFCENSERRDKIEIAWRELMKPVIRYFLRNS